MADGDLNTYMMHLKEKRSERMTNLLTDFEGKFGKNGTIIDDKEEKGYLN